MSLINSVIEFTSIALKAGLPLDIIKYIVSKNNDLTQCDFCLCYHSLMWYERNCKNCANMSVRCCNVCWQNDILNHNGRYCVKCRSWYCGECVVQIVKNPNNISIGVLHCECGHKQITQLCFLEKYDANNDELTRRTI